MASDGIIRLQARPASIEVDARTTAVVVVDMQNDFLSKGGMFDSAGIDIRGGQRAIEPTREVTRQARAAGIRVIYLKMEFREDLSDIGGEESPNAIKHRFLGVGQRPASGVPAHSFLIRGTWNADVVDELAPQPGDIVVPKQRFSGFYNTELDTILRTLGITTLIFTGVTTSICVDSTLRDAAFRDYRCVLLEDCTAEPIGADLARSKHDATLLTTELLFGWVSDSRAVLEALQAPASAR